MAPTCLSVTIYQIALHSISKFHFCLPHIFRISVELLICWDNDDNNRKMYNGLPCSSLEWLIFRLRIRCGSIVFPYMFTMQSFIAYLVCVWIYLRFIFYQGHTKWSFAFSCRILGLIIAPKVTVIGTHREKKTITATSMKHQRIKLMSDHDSIPIKKWIGDNMQINVEPLKHMKHHHP